MMNKLKFGAMKFSVSRKFSLEIETKTKRWREAWKGGQSAH